VYHVYTEGMSEPLQMGVREFRAIAGRRIDAAHFLNQPTIITKNDEPRAVLVSYAWYEAQIKGTG